MKLTSAQAQAVNEIYYYYLNGESKFVDFQSPTGSGKTFMIASLLSKIFHLASNEKIVVILNTLSSADLPKQFAKKQKVIKNI